MEGNKKGRKENKWEEDDRLRIFGKHTPQNPYNYGFRFLRILK